MDTAGVRRLTRLARTGAVCLAATAYIAFALGAVGPSQVSATTDHRAIVVVDTGARVDQITIHFTSDSISGKEALDLTGLPVVYQTYGSMGAAVCAIEHVGCSAGQDCLTCGGDHYWAYSHAKAGDNAFSPSPVGVSSMRVYDGDEEGWKWGKGESPQYVQQGTPPPATTTTTLSPAAGATGTTTTTASPAAATKTTSSPARASTATTGPSSAGDPQPGASDKAPTSAVDDAGGSTFSVPPSTGGSEDAARPVASSPLPTSHSRGGSLAGIGGFVAVLLGIGALGLWNRHRRRAQSG